MLDLAQSLSVKMTGITMGANEVQTCNARAAREGLVDLCRAVAGDAQGTEGQADDRPRLRLNDASQGRQRTVKRA
jgi:hypothetical protein